MKCTPLGNRVLLKIIKNKNETKGGIIIPDTAEHKVHLATVVAVGNDSENSDLKVGQVVLYDEYLGTKMEIDNIDHLIIKMDDILAIVEQ